MTRVGVKPRLCRSRSPSKQCSCSLHHANGNLLIHTVQVEPIEDIHEEEPAKSAETSTTHNEDIHEEEPAKSAETSTTNDEDQEPEKEHEIKQPSKGLNLNEIFYRRLNCSYN